MGAYGVGRNPRCDNCMAHCGFEGTAVNDAFRHPLKALRVALRGPRLTGPMAPELPFDYVEAQRRAVADPTVVRDASSACAASRTTAREARRASTELRRRRE